MKSRLSLALFSLLTFSSVSAFADMHGDMPHDKHNAYGEPHSVINADVVHDVPAAVVHQHDDGHEASKKWTGNYERKYAEKDKWKYKHKRMMRMHEKHAKMKAMDLDNSGDISVEEYTDYHLMKFNHMDKNGDGVLSHDDRPKRDGAHGKHDMTMKKSCGGDKS